MRILLATAALLAFAPQTLPPNTVVAGRAFTLAADPSADTAGAVVSGYRLWINGVAVRSWTPAEAVQNGVLMLPHAGLPAGTHTLQASVQWTAKDPAAIPQTGEVKSLVLTVTSIEGTTLPPGVLATPINLKLEWPGGGTEPPPPPPVVEPSIVSIAEEVTSGGTITASQTVTVAAGQWIVPVVTGTSSTRTYTLEDNRGGAYATAAAVVGGNQVILGSRREMVAGEVTVTARANAATGFKLRVAVLEANGIDGAAFTTVGATGEAGRVIPCTPTGTAFTQDGFVLCAGLGTAGRVLSVVEGTGKALLPLASTRWFRQVGLAGEPITLAFRRGECSSCVGMAVAVRVW